MNDEKVLKISSFPQSSGIYIDLDFLSQWHPWNFKLYARVFHHSFVTYITQILYIHLSLKLQYVAVTNLKSGCSML